MSRCSRWPSSLAIPAPAARRSAHLTFAPELAAPRYRATAPATSVGSSSAHRMCLHTSTTRRRSKERLANQNTRLAHLLLLASPRSNAASSSVRHSNRSPELRAAPPLAVSTSRQSSRRRTTRAACGDACDDAALHWAARCTGTSVTGCSTWSSQAKALTAAAHSAASLDAASPRLCLTSVSLTPAPLRSQLWQRLHGCAMRHYSV